MSDLTAGIVFSGDYRILRALGAGGMGTVYLAEQLSTGRQRALKVMHPSLVEDPKSRARFLDEARIAARIESEHVVEVVAAGVDERTGMPWIAMELLDGADLGELVEQRGPVPPEMVRSFLAQLGDALGAGHRLGIIHRDLKPENVFLAKSRGRDTELVLKVLDFGIARMVDQSRSAAVVTTAMGSPLWMAPEQGHAGAELRPSTDVWAMGLIAFYLLTGKSYWRASRAPDVNIAALLAEIMVHPLVPASQRAAEVGEPHRIPPGFDGWFARCVVRESNQRFPDAAAAAAALMAVLPSSSPLAPSTHRAALAATVAASPPMYGALPATTPSYPAVPPTAHSPAPLAPTAVVLSPPSPPSLPTQQLSSGANRGLLAVVGAGVILLVLASAGGLGGWLVSRRADDVEHPVGTTAVSAPVVPPSPVVMPGDTPLSPPTPTEPTALAGTPETEGEGEIATPEEVRLDGPVTLDSLAGRYRIVGSPMGDGCGARVELAARHLEVRARNSTVHADVVNRTYRARVEDGALIASGRFRATGTCAGTQISERWMLRPDSDGVLTGALVSTWQLPPGCQPCSIRFGIRAIPAGPREPRAPARSATRPPPRLPANPF